MIRGVSLAAAAIALAACASEPASPLAQRRLLVLGVDGMDPQLLRQYMREGRTPHLAALAERGGFVALGTTNPPQSPVAWSTFATGLAPSHHGIYDFVHRDPHALAPYLSTSRVEPGSAITIGSFALPTSGPKVELLRGGVAVWELLGRHGIPSTFVKLPANFPPRGGPHAELLSGMGTPDLLGTYGTFHLFTDDAGRIAKGNPSGGQVHALRWSGQHARATLYGPPNPTSATGEPLSLPVDIVTDRHRPVALVRIGDVEALVVEGEWTDWIPIAFDPGLVGGEVRGIVKLYLQSVRQPLSLYMSPINLDPIDPAVPIAAPASYAADLARDAGRYYTQGMPEDTKALADGVLSDDEFLAQADQVFAERLRLLDRELSRFDRGVLFFYFSSIDQVSHMFFRALAPDAPAHDARYANVIPDLYERVDAAIGRAIDRAGPDTPVIVLSDHGFAPYRRKVNLNTWLAEHGYLALRSDGAGDGPLGHIDWERTQAYALGLNQVFINVRGRERHGSVPASQRAVVAERLARQLEQMRDPDTGARVVTRAYVLDPGDYPDRTPDLIVGYARGYRSSDESAVGTVTERVVEDNRDKWSGDHCMDPSHVPGVLIASEPLVTGGDPPSLADLAPTILSRYDIAPPPAMHGTPRVQWKGEAR
ncbi:MAG: hypothetical protein D6689_17820 [Deltaproteobacteria bacterium]|nr:MAG: hypothetical protein D6689_17820 [Deltaproteobacteria bacterium]